MLSQPVTLSRQPTIPGRLRTENKQSPYLPQQEALTGHIPMAKTLPHSLSQVTEQQTRASFATVLYIVMYAHTYTGRDIHVHTYNYTYTYIYTYLLVVTKQ